MDRLESSSSDTARIFNSALQLLQSDSAMQVRSCTTAEFKR